MIEDTIHQICIGFTNGKSSLYEVTGTELDNLYENMREQKGYWNFSSDGFEYLINLNNVIEIVSEEVEEWKKIMNQSL